MAPRSPRAGSDAAQVGPADAAPWVDKTASSASSATAQAVPGGRRAVNLDEIIGRTCWAKNAGGAGGGVDGRASASPAPTRLPSDPITCWGVPRRARALARNQRSLVWQLVTPLDALEATLW